MSKDQYDGAPAASDSTAASLQVRGVNLFYGQLHAVKDVSFALAPGEIIALLGESGSGKSSLLRAIAGLEPITSGEISLDGRSLSGVAVHKRGVGLLFQDGQLFVNRNVGRNISYGLEVHHPGGRAEATRFSPAERSARVKELLDLIDMPGYEERPVTTLSGGQAQRVALARALAPRPRLLLLDEPLSALDRALREKLSGELRRILTATETTAVYVTHDQDEAFAIADRVGIMREGRLIALAEPFTLWRNPGNEQVARFLGMDPIITTADGTRLALWPDALEVCPREGGEQSAGAAADGIRFAALIRSARLGRGGVTLELDAVDDCVQVASDGAIKTTYPLSGHDIPQWLRPGEPVWARAEAGAISPLD